VLRCCALGFPVLVIDDGSTDETGLVAAMAGAAVERHDLNEGKAAALNSAFRGAKQRGARALVVLDGDGQHDCTEIPRLLQPILDDQADIVIGSRFLAGSSGSTPPLRRLGQRLITTAANAASRTKVTDSQSGFRAFSAAAVDTLLLHSGGFGAEVEMQFQARRHGLRVVEAPIRAVYAEPPKRNVVRHGLQVLNRLLALVEQHRPLLFFGVPGALLIVVGLTFGVFVTNIYQRSHELAVGYALITLLCAIAGLLSLFTSLVLHSTHRAFIELERRLSPPRQRPTGDDDDAEP
jgi:glycosyltransferase involved in cell wall biosynthesis